MAKKTVSQENYDRHRILATHIEAIYTEIEKLSKKKPAEKITPLISKKINHVITRVRDQVSNDEFLDAIETIPVEGTTIRLDEALIILGELRSVMARQWHSQPYQDFRRENGSTYEHQIMS